MSVSIGGYITYQRCNRIRALPSTVGKSRLEWLRLETLIFVPGAASAFMLGSAAQKRQALAA
jgi:hypothetical protein